MTVSVGKFKIADPSRIHILLVGHDDLAWQNLPSTEAEFVGIDDQGRYLMRAYFSVPFTADGPVAAELFMFGMVLRQELAPKIYHWGYRITVEWPLVVRGTQDDGPATVVQEQRAL